MPSYVVVVTTRSYARPSRLGGVELRLDHPSGHPSVWSLVATTRVTSGSWASRRSPG